MFSGIITNIGLVTMVPFNPGEQGERNRTGITVKPGRVKIKIPFEASAFLNNLKLGDSIAVDGVCLTVIEFSGDYFIVDISPETIEKTTFKYLTLGRKVNLERSLKLGDSLDGHIVLGHVDTVIAVSDIEAINKNKIITFSLNINKAHNYLKFIAIKGSVTINGASLTVNSVNHKNYTFTVNIIPHTLDYTNLSDLITNDLVNLEIDMFARYIENYMQTVKLENSLLAAESL